MAVVTPVAHPKSGTVIAEFSASQRTMLVMMCHGRMNYLMGKNPNAWMTAEYVELARTVEALMLDCAE